LFPEPKTDDGEQKIRENGDAEGQTEKKSETKTIRQLKLKFQVPSGKVSGIMGAMNLIQSKFKAVEIELTATDGSISEQDYEDKIMETFRQLGVELAD